MDGTSATFPVVSLLLTFALPIPILLYWLFEHVARERREVLGKVVDSDSEEEKEGDADVEDRYPPAPKAPPMNALYKVLLASLEHDVPGLDGARAKAGGLGKVVELISRHHPGDIVMVHPMVKEDGKVKYGVHTNRQIKEEEPLRINVEGVLEEVRVYRYETFPAGEGQFKATFLLLSHRMFNGARTKECIYPNPMTRRSVLRFFSLWNQAVGQLILRERPLIYHCPDFHQAVAPWYAGEHSELRVVLTLHNAEYQGSIQTDMIRAKQLPEMAWIWNLPEHIVAKHLVHQGRFNMLKAGVDFIREKQRGKGVCAVSDQYASECYTTFSLFWRLPGIEGVPNPMLESERTIIDPNIGLHQMKANAKKEIQERCNLNVDPNARLFVSLGRLVRQKGVDILADITPWLLTTFEDAQLIIAGPVADGFGCYAKEKLERITASPEFAGRVFIKCEFWAAPPSLKLATDFCVMPSRDEPFGYVDIEFAWCGAAMVGAKAGGLGKVPGFYYKAQNRDNLLRLRHELKTMIQLAMNATQEQLRLMADQGVKCSFPLAEWQQRTLDFYESVLPMDVLNMPDRTPTTRERASAAEDSFGMCKTQTMVELNSQVQQSFDMRGHEDTEFLQQELPEEELAKMVRQKLEQFPDANIEKILQSIGTDVNQDRETDSLSIWLLTKHLGEARVHWFICGGFIASLASSTITNVVAMYWGSRTSPFGQDKLFVFTFGATVVEIPSLWMPMIVTTVDGFACAIGVPTWAILSMWIEPRRLLALNLLLKPTLLFVIAPFQPSAKFALVLVFLDGLIGSGMLLFVVYNFMMTIKADMSRVAYRIGIMEICRYGVTWGLSAYVFIANPDKRGDFEPDDVWRPFWVLAPLGFLVILLTVIPGVLLLSAPGPYRDDRFPEWNLRLIYKKKSFIFLSISDILGDFGKFASGMFLSWCLSNNLTTGELGVFCLIFLGVYMLLAGAWSVALSKASRHGMSLLLGVVVLMAPPTILRAVVLGEVSPSFTVDASKDDKLSMSVLFICAVSLIMEGIRESSIWAAKIRILSSRWHLMSYVSLTLSISHFLRALSPWICEWMLAQPQGASFITTSSKQLADAVSICLIPISVMQFLAQVCAMPFIRKDMGLEEAKVKGKKKRHEEVHWLWRIRFGLSYAAWIFIVSLLILSFFRTYNEVTKPMDYFPANNCHVKFESQLQDVKKSCEERFYSEEGFHENEHGQITTARMKCYAHMYEKDGDTFIFSRGSCRILKCGAAPKPAPLGTKPSADLGEVWSQHCSMSGQNLVLVQLFEWRWDDIANECEDYLGPAGFDVVGVSPPNEHTRGDTWWIRYQPVSFKFESRSGTEAEFKDMVRRCAAVGVKVMSDVVLNHMAGTWIANPKRFENQQCGPPPNYPMECTGWNLTAYGDREFLHGQKGFDNFSRSQFHHYPFDDRANCGCPPWLNNQVVCDFTGLPDLNTESEEVRMMLGKFLEKLYSMGVTMIRIDAARHIFPESLAAIVNKIPWEYMALEVYHDVKSSNPQTFNKLLKIGALYDFAVSIMYTELMVDYPDRADKEDKPEGEWKWTCRDDQFKDFLGLRNKLPECKWGLCESPVPEDRAMLFVDNHDRQRDRFQEWRGGSSFAKMCDWNIASEFHSCLANHKYGLQYHILQALLLTKDYGDSVRVMSSYAFFHYRQGAPGVTPDSMHDEVQRIWQNGKPSGCRSKPTVSPVPDDWDLDVEKPWICEHRWEGVGGMVRFRKLVMKDRKANKMVAPWSDDKGRIGFSLGTVGFVAVSRGYNSWSKCGSKESKDLAKTLTTLPAGTYCNLARLPGAVVEPEEWMPSSCTSDTIVIDDNGNITKGTLPGGEVVVIHKDYLAETIRLPATPAAIPPLPTGADTSFWGWRNLLMNDTATTKDKKLGCCYAVDVNEENEPFGWENLGEMDAESCKASPGYGPHLENTARMEIGWDHFCPKTLQEAWEKIKWGRQDKTGTFVLPVRTYWIQTWILFVFIIVAETSMCLCVLFCKKVSFFPSRSVDKAGGGSVGIELLPNNTQELLPNRT